ncbi:very long chain fatty acid elongase AAEL008004-like [Ornithodoros turicata]|uniref:very long chain fatty acid elongase AAEL008004-like n=1 Tax=Ornithodoros turicata TaxID=34597 RepID=UPI0031398CDB
MDVVKLLDAVLSIRDPRTKDWMILQSPSFIAVLVGSYLYVAKVWGPCYMKDKKPYELKNVIQLYNLFQIVANIYFLTTFFYHTFWSAGYSLFCQGLTYSTDPHAMALLDAYYLYFFVRVADFLDTFFFLAKKKFSHVSVLHVTHHALVVFNGWLFLQLGSDGQVVFGVCLNAFVHIVMYSYYFLAALGPSVQKYLWWKKYLTRMQITQFVVIIIHALIPVFHDCGFPSTYVFIGITQVFLILLLFVNFYVQSYTKKQPVKVRPSDFKKVTFVQESVTSMINRKCVNKDR